ncbi:MAG: ABC transporter ATP-binding protein, partial [Armatimonadetes bacterium]|nr:ABC transporter ATP-binding protein [Armatimonadota bacterium]
FGLVGPDGAGKTTTIRMLGGIVPPSTGSIRVAGVDVVANPERVKELIGYVPQRFALYEDLTVQENMDFFADVYGVPRDIRKARQLRLLEFSRLEAFRDHLAQKLSGGMKRKLSLACTLIHQPEVLLLDEPTTGVDPISRRELWEILQRLLQEGTTVLYCTPYMDEAERCNRVAFLAGGRILACDEPRRLKGQIAVTVLELDASPSRLALEIARGTPDVEDVQSFGKKIHLAAGNADEVKSRLLVRLAARGVDVADLRVVAPSLEDVFVRLSRLQPVAERRGDQYI